MNTCKQCKGKFGMLMDEMCADCSESNRPKYVGMTLMKFEELGVKVNGETVDITPKNMIGFLPVFESLKQAGDAGWEGDKVIGIQGKGVAD